MHRLTRALSPLAAILFVSGAAALISPVQDLPPGHPPTGQQPQPEANPDDVASIDQIVTAYYDVISGSPNEERDWNRFRSLFMPNARFITTRQAGEQNVPLVLSPEQFMQSNQTYFKKAGYYEQQINSRVDQFGSVAHVFSTYAARRSPDDPKPYSRGINSIQLINTGERWWIVTIMWDFERPDNPIPPEYLPDEPGDTQ